MRIRSHVLSEGSTSEECLRVDRNCEHQKMLGFGGCFNELGWKAMGVLPQPKRDEIMLALFSEEGAAFEYCRTPIGASDFALDFYSLNECEGDYRMDRFSIDRDREKLIPYIKAAQAVNPNLRIWASPWCPPSWMKTNGHYACRSGFGGMESGLDKDAQPAIGTTSFRMHNGTLEAYACYFGKYLDAYEKEGIQVSAVHVQNEPVAAQVFPSCIWRAEDLALFIGNYLGPAFYRDGRSTEIWYGTLNVADPAYAFACLADSNCAEYVKGIGFQWAGKEAITSVHQMLPTLPLMQTETECGVGSNDWDAAEHTWELLKRYLLNGVCSYQMWNMVLDETGFSTWKWKQNALITVDQRSGEIRYNPEFYLIQHLSRFVKLGAVRIANLREEDDLIAFKNPGGEIVLLACNTSQAERELKVAVDSAGELRATLKPHSFNTFIYRQ